MFKINFYVDIYYFAAFSQYYLEKDPNIKAGLKEKAMEKYKTIMGIFEEQAKKNGGFFVGNKVKTSIN